MDCSDLFVVVMNQMIGPKRIEELTNQLDLDYSKEIQIEKDIHQCCQDMDFLNKILFDKLEYF
jgi:hypothetical protein